MALYFEARDGRATGGHGGDTQLNADRIVHGRLTPAVMPQVGALSPLVSGAGADEAVEGVRAIMRLLKDLGVAR